MVETPNASAIDRQKSIRAPLQLNTPLRLLLRDIVLLSRVRGQVVQLTGDFMVGRSVRELELLGAHAAEREIARLPGDRQVGRLARPFATVDKRYERTAVGRKLAYCWYPE